MNDTFETNGMQAVYDRLTRLEERGASRDDRMARMEAVISQMAGKLDVMADDVKAAKTGLRIGLWVSTTVLPVLSAGLGWFAHLLSGK